MGDLPSTVTTYYNLGKWNAGNNPSSSGLNGNWDKIDQTLHDIATGLSETSGSIGNWSGSPVGLDAAMGRRSLGLDNIANLGTGAVSTAEFNYLQGLTGNIQGQLNTLNADRHTHPNIAELNSVDQNLSKLNSVEFAGLTANGDNNGIFAGQDLGFAKKAGQIAQLVAGAGKDFIFSKLGNAVVNAANIASGALTELMRLTTAGALIVLGSITSQAAQGTAPFNVSSTTVVSNLNADLFEGMHGDWFVHGDSYNRTTNIVNQDANNVFSAGFYTGFNTANAPVTGDVGIMNIPLWASNDTTHRYNLQIAGTISGGLFYRITGTDGAGVWGKLWGEYTDGPGSGLDADLWDGYQFSDYLNQAVKTTSDVTHNSLSTAGNVEAGNAVIVNGNLSLKNSQVFQNKQGNGWVTFATRNTSSTEAVYDLNNIGLLTTYNDANINGRIFSSYGGYNEFSLNSTNYYSFIAFKQSGTEYARIANYSTNNLAFLVGSSLTNALDLTNAGATFSGNIAVNGAGLNTFTGTASFDHGRIKLSWYDPAYGISISSTDVGSGGWSRAYRFHKASDNSGLGGFGALGNVNTIETLWIGHDFNDSIAEFRLSDKLTSLYGNLNINGEGNNYVGGKTGFGTITYTERLNINGNAKFWGDIYSDNWNGVDPYLGYYIGRSGSVFSKITANELHVKAFIADLEMALAGSQMITKSVAKIYSDFTAGGYLVVEEIPGFTGNVFENGDFIRLRNQTRTNGGLDVVDVYGTVTFLSRDDATKTQTYSFSKQAGSGTTASKGSLALDYGKAGNGIYETVAQGPLGKTPYSQIATFATNPWIDMKIRSRVGDLTGIPTTTYGALKTFGIYTQDFYGEGNTNIVGTLTAGDANGWGNTFYVGRIKKNLLSNSNLKGDDFNAESLWTKYNSSTDVAAPDGSTKTTKMVSGSAGYRWFWQAGTISYKASTIYTLSVWIRTANNTTGSFDLSMNLNKTVSCGITDKWQRFVITDITGANPDNYSIYIGGNNPSLNTTFYFWGWQLEEGPNATPYQPTDGTSYLDGFGMWAVRGGFGATIQNPIVELSAAGMGVRNAGTVTDVTNTSGSYIGNWQSKAGFNGSIMNHKGLYGYQNNTLVMKIDDTGALFAGWVADSVKFSGGSLVLHKDGKIYAGKGSADDVTSTGFYFDRDNIFFGTQYMTSYLKWNSTVGMNIKTALFTLASSNVSIADTSGWFGANNILTYSANQVTLANWIATTDYLYSGNPSYGVLTLKGGAQPCIELWKDELNNISMWYNSDTDWGITGNVEMSELFHLGSGTNHIADWNITYQKLYCNLFELNAGGNAYINIGDSGNGVNVTTIGRYLYGGNGIGWHTVNSGIAATDSNADLIFELSSARRVISGFSFDKTKFYKDIDANNGVRLEASWNGSTGFSGLAVKKTGYDSLMVGDFAMPDLTYTAVDLTSTYSSNGGFELGNANSWNVTSQNGSGVLQYTYNSNTSAHWRSTTADTGDLSKTLPAAGSYFLGIEIDGRYHGMTGFNYNIYQDLANYGQLLGKNVKIQVSVCALGWYNSPTDYSNVRIPIRYAISNQSGVIAYYDVPNGGLNNVGWTTLELDVIIPDNSTYVRVSLAASNGSSAAYWNLGIDNLKVLVFNKAYSYINSGGFNFYNSPKNYFKMQGGAMSMALSDLKINGDNACSYRGEFTGTNTPANPKSGNWYTSGSYIYLYNGTSWLRLVTA